VPPQKSLLPASQHLRLPDRLPADGRLQLDGECLLHATVHLLHATVHVLQYAIGVRDSAIVV
jgi:hypothetical protein